MYLENKYPNISDRSKYETLTEASKPKQYYDGTVDELISEIIDHPKYDYRKHIELIKEIKCTNTLDLDIIATFGGKGRKWKEIIKDLKNPKKEKQLSLF